MAEDDFFKKAKVVRRGDDFLSKARVVRAQAATTQVQAPVPSMLAGGPLEAPWAAYGQKPSGSASVRPEPDALDIRMVTAGGADEPDPRAEGLGEFALKGLSGAMEGVEAIGGGILFPIEATAELLTQNIPNVLAGRGSMGEPSLDAAPFLPRTLISRRMMTGEDTPAGSPVEMALEKSLRGGAVSIVPGFGIEAAYLKPLRGAAMTLKAGKPLSQAERVAVMDAVPGATRVTPDGALTVAGKETSIEGMILAAGTKHADYPPPMDAIERVAEATADATIGNAVTGGSFGQAMRRGAEAVRLLPSEAVDEAFDLLPPSVGAWLRGGRKQGLFGRQMAAAVQDFQRKFENIPSLAESKGGSVRQAFGKVSESSEEAMNAVYDNIMYGTPVPQSIRDTAGEALPPLRRALSDLQELRREIDPEDLEQYPIWFKRMFVEPQEARAAKGLGPGGAPVPGLARRHQARDAYISNVSNLSPSEAEEVIARMPAAERPFQPMAPGRSKGDVSGVETPEWVGEAFGKHGETSIKWPDTKAGRKGRAKFRRMVEKDPRFKDRDIRFNDEDPIPREFAEGDPDAMTEIKDLPTVLKRSWGDVLRQKVNRDFFAKIPGMTDDAGQPLAEFVPRKGIEPPQAPPGYEFMYENGRPDRRWGILNKAEQEGQNGLYAVRSDLAAYLREGERLQSSLASKAHGFLDRWAINATNAPKTGLMNWLYNKVVVEPINGILPGSEYKKRARDLVRAWEDSEVAGTFLEDAMVEGLPLRKPDKGMASIDDVVEGIHSDQLAPKNADYEQGGRLYDAVAGSPLAERPLQAAAGAAGQGALRGLAEGGGVGRVVGEAVLGAVETTALRPVAQALREKYVNSDLFTTVAALLKHHDDALKAGLTGKEAMKQAVAKTTRLTQAGQWGRVGGFSEVLGAAPSGLAGAQRTGIRALQKAFLNRFIKFHEVNARLMLNASKENWKTAAGAAAGAATYYGIKEGGRKAAESLGILTPEESAFVDANIPDAVMVPTWDFDKNQPAVVSFPGQSVGSPIMDFPDSPREALTWITGPGFASTMDLAGFEKGQVLFSGAPLRKVEPEEGTIEDTVEALVRSGQNRWMSPYASTGRLAQGVREGVALLGEEREGKTAPTVPMLASGLLVGPVRDVIPEELKETNRRAFIARKSEIEKEASKARSAAIPSMKEAARDQSDERIADLAEEYLRKGMMMEDLQLPSGVHRILSERGWSR